MLENSLYEQKQSSDYNTKKFCNEAKFIPLLDKSSIYELLNSQASTLLYPQISVVVLLSKNATRP